MAATVSIVIPARWESKRLPGKILSDLGGKSLLRHTWERVTQVKRACEVVVAVDNDRVKAEVESWGGVAVMTDPKCASGAERIASIVSDLMGDFIINVQADECFIETKLLYDMIERWDITGADIITPVTRIDSDMDLKDPSVVKVVLGQDGRALYFSRSPIPFIRDICEEDWLKKHNFWGHIGVYGYARRVLEEFERLGKSLLEEVEKLEQLRFLDGGYCIQTFETEYHALAVDTQNDLERARELILDKICL